MVRLKLPRVYARLLQCLDTRTPNFPRCGRKPQLMMGSAPLHQCVLPILVLLVLLVMMCCSIFVASKSDSLDYNQVSYHGPIGEDGAFFDYSEYKSIPSSGLRKPTAAVKSKIASNFSAKKGGSNDEGIVDLTPCPITPPNLLGRQKVALSSSEEECRELVLATGVRQGGSWGPPHCRARYRLALIVPYRDRPDQLWTFLTHMHQFLQRQELNYTLYVVEQSGTELFNRAKLLNVGFREASKDAAYDCVVFHDVDMLPEDDRHLYHCSPMPRHLVVASSNNKYRSTLSFQRDRYYGGACMMTPEHVQLVNGWANRYWGWGGEDDDMWRRVAVQDLPVWRYPASIARYTMLPHGAPPGINRHSYEDLAKFSPQFRSDGLNNLAYKVLSKERLAHHTRILADIGGPTQDTPVPNKKSNTS